MMFKRSDLHQYQNTGSDFIKEKGSCALFLDMGLGKTTTTLTALSDILKFKKQKVLIIAPLRVANNVWKQEALKWEHLKHLKIQICTGTEKERISAFKQKADIYVLNKENVHWLVTKCKKWVFDIVVIDESSTFKSPKSNLFKAMKAVRKFIKQVILLTGTPSPNSLLDLWSQIYLIDQGKRLEKTITRFKTLYFKATGYMNYKFVLLEGTDDYIRKRISDVCLSMKASDYLTLPDRLDITVPIDFQKQDFETYIEFERDFVTTLRNGVDISTPHAGAMVNKLLQFCSGAVYDENKDYHVVHDEKIQALKDIISDNPSETVLVAYNFKSDLERLKKSFPHAVVLDKKGECIEKWNKGEIPLLLAHPASAGHGLNLQHGGNLIVWFSLTWSLENYQQFNARLYRQGQSKPVKIIHLTMNDSVDEKVVKVLSSKAKTQDGLMTALKREFLK